MPRICHPNRGATEKRGDSIESSRRACIGGECYRNTLELSESLQDQPLLERGVHPRWVILDVTWDNWNKFEDGQFKTSSVRHVYFDPCLEAFSHVHQMMP